MSGYFGPQYDPSGHLLPYFGDGSYYDPNALDPFSYFTPEELAAINTSPQMQAVVNQQSAQQQAYQHAVDNPSAWDLGGAGFTGLFLGSALAGGGAFGGGGSGAVGNVSDVAGGAGSGSAVGGATAGAIPDVTLPAGAAYIPGAGGAGYIGGVGSALDSGASAADLLFPMGGSNALTPLITNGIPEAGAAGGSLLGAPGAAGAAAGAGAVANAPFSGGADPNLPPEQAPPGTQTPGGYDTEIPNLSSITDPVSGIPDWLKALQPYTGLIGAGLGLVDSALQPDHTTQTNNATNNSTSTSSLQLPSQITGPASDALARAGQLLTQGPQFAPMPYGINKAAGDLATLGQNTAPTTSSFASGANINPYLDLTFNAAADATQNRLGSEFANAGQYGSPQNQQARSQELQQLAAGIYGPGYQNAQNLQYGAQEAGVQRGLTQQDANLNRTIQAAGAALPIGQYMAQRGDAQANAPTTGLNSYIGQLTGLSPYFPGTSTQSQSGTQTGNYTQPVYNNPLLSALGGAQLGSYFSSLFGPNQQGSSAGGMATPQSATWQQGGSMPAYSYL